jgi:hypothetical protein
LEILEYPPALCGVCNFSCENKVAVNTLAVSITNVVDPERSKMRYEYVSETGFDEVLHPLCLFSKVPPKKPTGIKPVAFAGLPFTFMRRDIVNQFILEGDLRWNMMSQVKDIVLSTQRQDAIFSWNLFMNDIPYYCDFDVRLKHLRNIHLFPQLAKEWGVNEKIDNYESLLVGKKSPEIIVVE